MIEIKEIQIDAKDLNKTITAPLNESNIWKGFDNQADMQYIKECAESVGMDVTDKTAFSTSFIAEVMRKMKEQSIVIPKGTTNGDMIKAMFPDLAEYLFLNVYEEEWWNSPYRKEQE